MPKPDKYIDQFEDNEIQKLEIQKVALIKLFNKMHGRSVKAIDAIQYEKSVRSLYKRLKTITKEAETIGDVQTLAFLRNEELWLDNNLVRLNRQTSAWREATNVLGTIVEGFFEARFPFERINLDKQAKLLGEEISTQIERIWRDSGLIENEVSREIKDKLWKCFTNEIEKHIAQKQKKRRLIGDQWLIGIVEQEHKKLERLKRSKIELEKILLEKKDEPGQTEAIPDINLRIELIESNIRRYSKKKPARKRLFKPTLK